MTDLLMQLRKQTAIVALCYSAVGLLFVCIPDITVKAIGLILSIAVLAFGALKIIVFFARQSSGLPDRTSLPVGIILAVAALVFFFKPDILVSIVYVILGLTLVVNGALKLQVGVELRRVDNPFWGSVVVASLAVIILGAIAIFAPFTTAKTVIVLVGVSMICGGVFDLVSAIFFIKNE